MPKIIRKDVYVVDVPNEHDVVRQAIESGKVTGGLLPYGLLEAHEELSAGTIWSVREDESCMEHVFTIATNRPKGS